MKLDIGCGQSKKTGYWGIDKLALPGVDQQHDLNIFPYPLAEGSVEEIWMDQVLEHLDNPLQVMEELYRLCKNGALLTIGVPYFRSFYSSIDPTHQSLFGTYWFAYFDPTHPFHQRYQYSPAKFLVKKIEFDREFKKPGLIHKLVLKFANNYPHLYEAKFSHLYPLNSLTFYLEAKKD